MRIASLLVASTITLCSCGGGEAPQSAERRFKVALFASEASIVMRRTRPQATALAAPAAAAAAAVVVDAVDAATQLLDFGEASLPAYFPGHQTNRFWEGYVYRYYPASAGGGLHSQVRVEGDEIVENAPRPMPADSEGEVDPSPIAHVSADPAH